MPLQDPRTVLPPALELRLETVEGFVSRGGRFVPRADGSFEADRWISGVFNARPSSEDDKPAATEHQNGAGEQDGRIALSLETVTGIYPNRGGGFSLHEGGTWLGDRWVSDYRDVRLRS